MILICSKDPECDPTSDSKQVKSDLEHSYMALICPLIRHALVSLVSRCVIDDRWPVNSLSILKRWVRVRIKDKELHRRYEGPCRCQYRMYLCTWHSKAYKMKILRKWGSGLIINFAHEVFVNSTCALARDNKKSRQHLRNQSYLELFTCTPGSSYF